MNNTFVQHLEPLYGAAVAADVERRLEARLDGWRPRLPVPADRRGPLGLTQRDVLLITYADQVRETGQFPLGTLARFCARHLKGVVTGVHLLPFYPWSSDDGFSVKDYSAVDPAYGGWEDVARLRADFDLMFDAVLNHASAEGEWFRRFLADDPAFRDFFLSVEGSPDLSRVVRPRALPLLTRFQTAAGPRDLWTTFSADQVDLNYKNPDVLLAVVEVVLWYVAQGARFLRLDAVAFLWKEVGTSCLHLAQTHQVIQLLRSVLDDVAPHVLLITETNVPHAENLSYFGDGRNEAQLVYNFALPPLVLHSFVTANAESLGRWAGSLVLPSDRVTFFNFLASHDGIGLNPVRGILAAADIEALVRRAVGHGGFVSYKSLPDGSEAPYELNINFLDALSDPAAAETSEVAARKLITAHAILFSLEGVPGIYFHSLFGSRGDRAGAERSAIPRRVNRQKLDANQLEEELADPDSLRARVLAGLCDLLRVRRRHLAFAPHAPQRVLALDGRLFAVWRQSGDGQEAVLCVENVSPEGVEVFLGALVPEHAGWELIWGAGRLASSRGVLVLPPYGGAWLTAVRPSGSAVP